MEKPASLVSLHLLRLPLLPSSFLKSQGKPKKSSRSLAPTRSPLSFLLSTQVDFDKIRVRLSESGTSRGLTDSVVVAASDKPILLLSDYVKDRLPGGFTAQWYMGTGRKKCAIARVVLLEGNGKVIINNRSAREYLQGHPMWVKYVRAPLKILGLETSVDVFVKAHGGGLSGQAQAICLGVARALLKVNANYRKALKVYA